MKSFFIRNFSRPDPTTSLDATIQIVKLAASMSSAIAPLQTACNVALAILQTAQNVRQLRDDHLQLAARAAHITVAVVAESTALGTLADDVQRNVDSLHRSLQDINDHMITQSKLGWTKRMFKAQTIARDIADYNLKLDDCSRLFHTRTLLAIHQILASNSTINQSSLLGVVNDLSSSMRNVIAISQEAHLGINRIAGRLEDMSRSANEDTDAEIMILRRDQLQLHRTLRILPSGSLFRAQVNRATTEESKVVVKMYQSGEEGAKTFRTELALLRSIFHPNLHQVIGRSALSATNPFVVLTDFSHSDVDDYMNTKLQGRKVESFMAALHMLQGIASGAEYLRSHDLVTKHELTECTKTSNFVLTPSGNIIIGHNLVMQPLQLALKPLPSYMDEWLKEVFWYLTARFVYAAPQDESDWDWVMAQVNGRSASHLRMLEWFTEYKAPSFTTASQQLNELLDILAAQETQKLTFRDIRQALIRVNPGPYVYRPLQSYKVAFGDVCFMDHGNPVVIMNALSRSSLTQDNESPLVLTCTDTYEIGQSDGSGNLRHKYFNVMCATVRRYTTCEMTKDYRASWEFLITHASQICDEYAQEFPDLKPQDLIFVVGVQSDLRYSFLDWVGNDASANPPSEIQFVEYENVDLGEPWGHWILEDGTIVVCEETAEYHPNESYAMTVNRFPQNIMFVQLEQGEADMHCDARITEIE